MPAQWHSVSAATLTATHGNAPIHARTEAVLKAVVAGAWEHKIRTPKLAQIAEALELGRVHELDAQ